MHDTALLAWTAGFFDGEGSVSISIRQRKKKPYRGCNDIHTLVVRVANTHKGCLDRLAQAFGGKVYKQKVREGCKQQWQWLVQSKLAREFLEEVLPYLYVKKRQAEIGLELEETRKPLKRKVTMADVAMASGKARSTCYECIQFGSKSRFSPETVKLVRDTAEMIGYKPESYRVTPQKLIDKRESLRTELVALNAKGA